MTTQRKDTRSFRQEKGKTTEWLAAECAHIVTIVGVRFAHPNLWAGWLFRAQNIKGLSMEGFSGLLVIGGILFLAWIFFSSDDDKKTKKKSTGRGKEKEVDISEVMSGDLVGGDEGWRTEPASDSQIDRIRQIGLKPPKRMTKGRASDIYGLTLPVEDDVAEKLRFFGIPRKGLTQTHARHLLRELFLDKDNFQKWEKRPAETISKVNAKYFGIKVPKDISQAELEAKLSEFGKSNGAVADSWFAIEDAIVEMRDAEVCEMYDSKKPSISQALAAIQKLIDSGVAPDLVQDDEDKLFDALFELYPKLKR